MLVFYGAVLLIALRWAVLATAILVLVFLIAPLAQSGTVKGNPYTFSPGIYVYSPAPNSTYWAPNVEISFKIILDTNLAKLIPFFTRWIIKLGPL